jgi:hypothetical protein
MNIEVEVGYPSRSLVTRLLSLVRKVGCASMWLRGSSPDSICSEAGYASRWIPTRAQL